ncbi:hypothetical protein ACIPSE_38840 [Streptomyces sp. NPDC090106]|uniref:hypothetical protein n=1 Tax=Streptomyces sp. NPDC090106 TaxID=3365946 RepID=UPI00380C9480
MIKALKRTSTTILLASGAIVGLLTGSAGSASAASIQNDFQKSYYLNVRLNLSAWSQCQSAEDSKNRAAYGTPDPSGAEKYYCSWVNANQTNLWWAHY